MEEEVVLRLKAELLCSGTVRIPKRMHLPFPTSKSSAGPGAGSESIVVRFGGVRAKIPISKASGKIALRETPDGKYGLFKGKSMWIGGVTLEPTLCHAPGQAFVSLGRSCTMDCAFCTINESAKKDGLSPEQALEMIFTISSRPGFKSIAITSGVPTTVDAQVATMAALLKLARALLPDVPMGVEPLVTKRSHLLALKEAGADEIKINLEAANEAIFGKVCPRRDYDLTLRCIGWAAEIFGKGKVTSNVIIGMGESEKDVARTVESLAKLGSIANIRMLRVNERNRSRLRKSIGTIPKVDEMKLLKLAKLQKKMLEKYGLSPRSFKTMCFPCACCDLVPDIDF